MVIVTRCFIHMSKMEILELRIVGHVGVGKIPMW